MGTEIKFTVYGGPQQAGSKKPFTPKRKDGTYVTRPGGTLATNIVDANEKKLKPWMALVRSAALEVYSGPLLCEPLGLVIDFYMPRLKGHFGTGRNRGKLKESAPKYQSVMPDLTKLVRGLEDALKGIIWQDDALVSISGPHIKFYGEPARAEVCVWTIDDEEGKPR